MTTESLISRLKKLVTLDQQLSRLRHERSELSKKEQDLGRALQTATDSHQKATLIVKELEKKNRLEEKRLLGLSEQIHGRKKSLLSLGTYKLQQAALREIDTSEREIIQAEEKQLEAMQLLEEKQIELIRSEDIQKNTETELKELKESLADHLDTIFERGEKIKQQRLHISQTLDSKMLTEYDRAYERHAPDVISVIENQACSECAYSVAPKLLLEIQAGSTIVRCRGCGKILALE